MYKQRIFIHEGKRSASRLRQFAQPESQQNAVFHPSVYHPSAVDLFRRADLALSKRIAEFKKHLARFGIMLDLAQGRETLDGRFKGLHGN